MCKPFIVFFQFLKIKHQHKRLQIAIDHRRISGLLNHFAECYTVFGPLFHGQVSRPGIFARYGLHIQYDRISNVIGF